ncbi:MAG: hypothetical protein ACYTDY_06020, partial [Planctomycetota bacterium]
LAGRLPFEFETYPELLHQLREKQPDAPTEVEPTVPQGLSEICLKALAFRRESRFPGAGLLAEAIRSHRRESAVRTEIRGLMQEAEVAFEGADELPGEVLLKQLDRISALCLRVLEHRKDHARARRLIEESDRLRDGAIRERERAIREKEHSARLELIRTERERRVVLRNRVILGGLAALVAVVAVVAGVMYAQKKESRASEEMGLRALEEPDIERGAKDQALTRARAEREARDRKQAELESERRARLAAEERTRKAREELEKAGVSLTAAERRVRAEKTEKEMARGLASREKLLREAAEQRAEAERAAKEKALEDLREEREARRKAEERAAAPEQAPPPPTEPVTWSKESDEKLTELARELLRARRPEDREEILARAAALGSIPRARLDGVVKSLFEVARSGPRCDAKEVCTAKYPEFQGTYHLVNAGNGRKGLLVGLHRGMADGRSAAELWASADRRGLLCAYPNASRSAMESFHWDKREGYVLSVLKEIKRTYTFDTNRVYLVGMGAGGDGVWFIGRRNADLFAGLGMMYAPPPGTYAGGKFVAIPEMLADFRNTPIYGVFDIDYSGRRDPGIRRSLEETLRGLRKEHGGGYEHVCLEKTMRPSGAIQSPLKGFAPIVTLLAKQKRDPYPQKVVWTPSAPAKLTFSWLRRSPRTKLGQCIVASIDRNVVEVSAEAPDGLSLLLADEMFDRKKPVTVLVNGKPRFEGLVDHDPRAALESVIELIDPQQVFTYRIDL